jgi:hypothetical protein
VALSPAAAQAASNVGLLIDGIRIDRTATAERIIQFLEQHDQLAGGKSTPANAPTLDQICTAVFNSLELELYLTVTQLCSLSAAGTVQHRLNGRNVMLCGGRVNRSFTMDGSAIPAHRNFTVRFISQNPQTIVETLIEPRTRALGRAAERYQGLVALTEQRVPALAPYLQQQRLRASQQTQYALGVGVPAPHDTSTVAGRLWDDPSLRQAPEQQGPVDEQSGQSPSATDQ